MVSTGQAEVALVASFKERVTRQLKDPGSAQFQDLRLNTARSALCGKINAKNSYGGYVGLRDFVASDTEVHIKPEGCGSVPITHWIDRPADGTACINYLMATIEKKLCN